jgi:uncharacterized protein involved in oxidation of intracellular sulfur
MHVLIILNDPPYGTERSYNGLRLARQLTQDDGVRLRLFLMADAVACAKDGQTTPNGYYNIGRMVRSVVRKGADVGACGTCMDARGLTEEELLDGVHRSTMDELGAWTLEADKVVVF